MVASLSEDKHSFLSSSNRRATAVSQGGCRDAVWRASDEGTDRRSTLNGAGSSVRSPLSEYRSNHASRTGQGNNPKNLKTLNTKQMLDPKPRNPEIRQVLANLGSELALNLNL